MLTHDRDWVISHARQHVLKCFERLTTYRKRAHASYLASLPNYSIYMQHSGHPPIESSLITILQAKIAEAHAELKRGIDADWRASVLRYPAHLDYFYSIIEIRIPSERDLQLSNPPPAKSNLGKSDFTHSTRGKDRIPRDANSPLKGKGAVEQ